MHTGSVLSVMVAALPQSEACARMCPGQVLKDLYALDDGGASLAAGTDLGSALFRMGLVHLLLAFLLALGPIRPRTRAAEGSAVAAAQAPGVGDAFCASAAASVQSAAAGLPKHPPYLGYRTDIVAGAYPAPPCSAVSRVAATVPWMTQ